jgi:hypothetical protein
MKHVSAVLPLAGGRVAFVQKVRLSAPSEIQDKLVAIARSAHKLPGSTRTHALAVRTVVSHVTHQRRALLNAVSSGRYGSQARQAPSRGCACTIPCTCVERMATRAGNSPDRTIGSKLTLTNKKAEPENVFRAAVNPLRCASVLRASPGWSSWPPVRRMRLTPRRCGQNLRRLCNPASLQAGVRHPRRVRSAHASIGLRYPCFAQAQGDRHWPPVQRMRWTPVLRAPANILAFRLYARRTQRSRLRFVAYL